MWSVPRRPAQIVSGPLPLEYPSLAETANDYLYEQRSTNLNFKDCCKCRACQETRVDIIPTSEAPLPNSEEAQNFMNMQTGQFVRTGDSSTLSRRIKSPNKRVTFQQTEGNSSTSKFDEAGPFFFNSKGRIPQERRRLTRDWLRDMRRKYEGRSEERAREEDIQDYSFQRDGRVRYTGRRGSSLYQKTICFLVKYLD